jgi:hypothetical protein
MKKTLKNKKIKEQIFSPAEKMTYVFSIGIGALVGFLCGGITLSCIGCLLGFGIGYLIDTLFII